MTTETDEIIKRLRWAVTEKDDEEAVRITPNCGELRRIIALIERQAAEIAELTKANAQLFDAATIAAPAPMTDAEVDAAINDTFPGDATITHTTWDWLRAIFRAGRASK